MNGMPGQPEAPGRDAGRQAREREARAREEKRRIDRLIDAENEQSFPASDPPSWTLGQH